MATVRQSVVRPIEWALGYHYEQCSSVRLSRALHGDDVDLLCSQMPGAIASAQNVCELVEWGPFAPARFRDSLAAQCPYAIRSTCIQLGTLLLEPGRSLPSPERRRRLKREWAANELTCVPATARAHPSVRPGPLPLHRLVSLSRRRQATSKVTHTWHPLTPCDRCASVHPRPERPCPPPCRQ